MLTDYRKTYFEIVSNMKYMKQESFPSWLFANWPIVVDDPAVNSIATSPEKPIFFEIANETAVETGRSCNQKVISHGGSPALGYAGVLSRLDRWRS